MAQQAAQQEAMQAELVAAEVRRNFLELDFL